MSINAHASRNSSKALLSYIGLLALERACYDVTTVTDYRPKLSSILDMNWSCCSHLDVLLQSSLEAALNTWHDRSFETARNYGNKNVLISTRRVVLNDERASWKSEMEIAASNEMRGNHENRQVGSVRTGAKTWSPEDGNTLYKVK